MILRPTCSTSRITRWPRRFIRWSTPSSPDFVTFTDITFYQPVQEPVVFFAAPLINRGTLIGVLVLELPIDTLNTLLNLRDGLGKTGETYIIGGDFLFRSDSRFLKSLGVETTILNSAVRVDTAGQPRRPGWFDRYAHHHRLPGRARSQRVEAARLAAAVRATTLAGSCGR